MRPPVLRVWSDDELIVDSFAGGGGASLGIRWALGRDPDIAINHNPQALAIYLANHSPKKHYREDVWKVDPLEATDGRPVGLMWLSPDCTHHSKAKGAKPLSKKIRGLAWVAIRWAKALGPERQPRGIILENVEEFQKWGPLYPKDHPNPKLRDRPNPEKVGKSFRLFVARLRGLGYDVEWREMRACDFGAPTIRKRLFLIARCDGQPIVWPARERGKGTALPVRVAAECMDWSIPCPSIFITKKEAKAAGFPRIKRPLVDATLRRVARGIQRFVIDNPRPYLVNYHSAKRPGDDRIADLFQPLPVQGRDNRYGLVVPYLTEHANASTQRIFDVQEPLRTHCGGVKGGHFAMVAPCLVPMQHENRPTSIEEPVQTITTQGNKFNLVAPCMVPRYGEREGQAPRAMSIDAPFPTIVPTQNGAQLVSAFLAKHFGGYNEGAGAPLDKPTSAVTGRDHHALVTAQLDLIPAPPAPKPFGNHSADVAAFLIAYYGTDQNAGDLRLPIPTIPGTDRFGIVTVQGAEYVIVDIGMRMLVPRELARAHDFPDSYQLAVPFKDPKTGKTKPLSNEAQTSMIGNSVPPGFARAIAAANFADLRSPDYAEAISA